MSFDCGDDVSQGRSPTLRKIRSLVWRHWKRHGRHNLPWRRTRDPYKILVSEVMLQQTQVSRVVQKYPEFVRALPDVHALACAPLRTVLHLWSGLGYNRRAKFLHEAAKEMVRMHGGRVPKDSAALRALPGVGEYTAAAVRVFAYDLPDTLLETNIRTAITHHFFPRSRMVHDTRVRAVAGALAQGLPQRTWHAALMDYGAHLKSSGVRVNNKSAHYTKQKAFKGSAREVRGAIMRALQEGKQPRELSFDTDMLSLALTSLERDGLIQKTRALRWRI